MKMRTVLLILLVEAALSAAFSASHTDARTIPAPIVMSGGKYVLTLQAPAAGQATGYRLVDAPAADEEGSGCCCKGFLPCVLRRE
jgi:hypothetical protein